MSGESYYGERPACPPAVVRDLTIHPRENDLVVGTYGRAAWITDISPLQQFSKEVAGSACHLFEIEAKPRLNYSQQALWGNYHMTGSNHLRTPNEPNGLEIWTYFRERGRENALLTIHDLDGKQVFQREFLPEPGIGKLYWDTARAEVGSYLVELSYLKQKLVRRAVVRQGIYFPVFNHR